MKEPVLYEVEPDPTKVERYQTLFEAYNELHDIHGYKKGVGQNLVLLQRFRRTLGKDDQS